jgi:hypothetical protein
MLHPFLRPSLTTSLIWVSPPKLCMHYSSPHICHMAQASQTPWFDHPNNI